VNTDKLKREISQRESDAFIQKYIEVKRWLRKVESDYTRSGYVRQLIRYCEATGKTPSELIELKERGKKHEIEDLLDEFIEEATKANALNSVVWNIAKAIKSFYKWNYCDLSRGAGKISRIKVKAYRTPDKETLLKFMEGMLVRDKALVSLMACTGIAEGSIPRLRWKHVQEINEKDIPHIALTSAEIKGGGRGKYEGVEQHTFLTPYAKRMLLTYKEWRERKEGRALTPEDYLFTTITQPYKVIALSEVRAIFSRHSKAIGIKFSPHDLRRFVQTALETAKMQPNWVKKILRHKVAGEESPYSQPKLEELREAYRSALPYLDLSEKPTPTKEDIRKVVAATIPDAVLEPIARSMGITLEQLRINMASGTEEKETETEHGKESLDRIKPEDCQFLITENELENYIARGFRFVAVLPSGKILVSNE
jgi:integrase